MMLSALLRTGFSIARSGIALLKTILSIPSSLGRLARFFRSLDGVTGIGVVFFPIVDRHAAVLGLQPAALHKHVDKMLWIPFPSRRQGEVFRIQSAQLAVRLGGGGKRPEPEQTHEASITDAPLELKRFGMGKEIDVEAEIGIHDRSSSTAGWRFPRAEVGLVAARIPGATQALNAELDTDRGLLNARIFRMIKISKCYRWNDTHRPDPWC
jgi:hypothetical protein